MNEKTRLQRLKHGILDLPSNTRMAAESAWRGRERGLAIIAGVFLASLVITTVLAYLKHSYRFQLKMMYMTQR